MAWIKLVLLWVDIAENWHYPTNISRSLSFDILKIFTEQSTCRFYVSFRQRFSTEEFTKQTITSSWFNCIQIRKTCCKKCRSNKVCVSFFTSRFETCLTAINIPRVSSELQFRCAQKHKEFFMCALLCLSDFNLNGSCPIRSRESVVRIATGYGLDDQGVGVWAPVVKNFIFSTPSIQVLGFTQLPTQWGPESLSPGVKLPGRETDHSSLTSVDNQENMDLYIHSPYSRHSA
jgi:hypothetical protein